MPTYRVQLFASLREQTGQERWTLATESPIAGAALLAEFFDAFPELDGLRRVTRLAVNQAFLTEDRPLDEEDELALIPPVSGG